MKVPFYQVHAFTSRLFGGNPAAVVELDQWLPDGVLQNIAAENNAPATAFMLPGSDIVPLRWFTPKTEIDLCGHGSLAAGHVMLAHHHASASEITFSTPSGPLKVRRNSSGGFELDLPSRPASRIEITPGLISALGRRPAEAYKARDIMAIFNSESNIREINPDFRAVAELETFGLCISAPGTECDFVSRFFAPRKGIPEDAVTGSAHCTLVPYWAERLGKTRLRAKQLSRRIGELECELHGDRVTLAGQAVEYVRGEIELPRF